MKLREHLKKAREGAGLSQSDVATAIGVGRNFISMVEHGRSDTTLAVAESWAQACGARLELIQEGDDLGSLVDEERHILLAWRGLNADRRPTLLRFLLCISRLDPVVMSVLQGAIEHACQSYGGQGASEEEAPKRHIRSA